MARCACIMCAVLHSELLVTDAVWVEAGAESLGAVILVLAVVAVEEDHPTVALERDNVRAQAIEEPAIVTDHYGSACRRVG